MSWLNTILHFGRPSADTTPQQVLVDGKMLSLPRAEVAGLHRLAELGYLKKAPNDATVGTGPFTQGIPAFWFARAVETSGGHDALNDPYGLSVWVQRAIKKISGPVSSVRLCFLQSRSASGRSSLTEPAGGRTRRRAIRRIWTSRGVVKRLGGDDEVQEVDLPALRNWLERPMRGLSYTDFVEASIGWLKMQECFWLLSDESLVPFPEVRESYPPIIVARPNCMRPVLEDGQLLGWTYTQPGGREYALVPDQVIQLRYWNPHNDFRGLGEYAAAHLAAEADHLAGKFARNLMANNGDLGGIIIAKSGVPSDPQREQIIMDLRAKRAAQLRGDLRYTFLTGDIDIKDPKITSVDSAFIAQRLENRHEIAIAFGVPPSMFDVKASYSIGSASDYFQLILDTCIPTGEKFCDALERLIQRLTGERVTVGLEWDEHPVMQEVRRERFASVDTFWAKGMPMDAISEYLGLDLPEYEGSDVGYLPLGVSPASEATLPEPPPATNPALAEEPDDEPAAAPEPEAVKTLRAAVQAKAAHRRGANQRLWEHHVQSRQATVKAIQAKVQRVLYEFRTRALRHLEGHLAQTHKAVTGEGVQKGLVDVIFDAGQFAAELGKAVSPVLQAALGTASRQLLDEVGYRDPWELPPEKVLTFVHGRTQQVQECDQTVRAKLNAALTEGLNNGESHDDLADRVRTVFADLGQSDAKRIAVTETGMAYNYSRHETMRGVGIQYKRWLSSHGPNVRDSHRAAELEYGSNAIPLDQPFRVGGYDLMYPGDPEGPPQEIINCQCIQLASRTP